MLRWDEEVVLYCVGEILSLSKSKVNGMSAFDSSSSSALPTEENQSLPVSTLPTPPSSLPPLPAQEPLPSSPLIFSPPIKAIHTKQDFEKFLKSPAHKEILDFVKECAEAIVGIPCHERPSPTSSVVRHFVTLMDRLYDLVNAIPPIQQPMRFGNKAFRLWHQRISEEINGFLSSVLPPALSTASVEILPYFLDLFGNATRIDYGTGHELNFAIIFLMCKKLELIHTEDLSEVVLCGFKAYIRVMRKLQMDYLLEPAGSHGVWGLDDYHCLLFLWGSAQLSRHHENSAEITPSSVHDMTLLKEYSEDYLYLEGILFIRSIKTGAAFAETSPMLNDISHITDWSRICSGLLRLFQAEVLGKFPVIQHLLFGSLLRADWQ